MSRPPRTPITIGAPSVSRTPEGAWRLTAEVDGVPIWLEADRPLSPAGEVWVAAFLIPAMGAGRDLEVMSAVDASFLQRMSQVQELVGSWWGLGRVAIRPESTVTERRAAKGCGLFFSGGVDSVHSLVQERDELTDLVFIHGFDIPLDDHARFAGAAAQVRRVAEGFGLGVVHVTTNLRSHPLLRPLKWRFEYGGALAAVGHALSGELGTVLLASGSVGGRPAGNHPDLDPLWSSDRIGLVNVGDEVRRMDKTAMIARNDVAMANLRVCWENASSDLNCGRCEKCLRTLIHLEVAGARDRAITFPEGDLAEAIHSLPGIKANHRIFWEEALESVRDPRIRSAMKKKLSTRYPPRRTLAARAIRRLLRRTPVLWRLVG